MTPEVADMVGGIFFGFYLVRKDTSEAWRIFATRAAEELSISLG